MFVLVQHLGRLFPQETGWWAKAPVCISGLTFPLTNDELSDKMCSALRKVLARKASSSAEWTEASEESNQEQILWAWSQVVRWSKNLYSAS